MADSSNFVVGSLPVFDEKLFDNWRVKMLVVFCFQDCLRVGVPTSFAELSRNATEELFFKQQQKLDSKAWFLIY